MTIGRIPSVEGGIQPTIVDAKGDLIAATAADTVNRLAVGDNDQILVADSSTSTGLAWKSNATPFAAGKNKIINGDFGIWQRGTSYTSNTYGVYGAPDRFRVSSIGGTSTCSQQSFTAGTAPVAGYEGKFFFRVATAASSMSYWDIGQPIESVRTFAGETVTVSLWAKASTATTVILRVRQDFGSGGSTAVNTDSASFALTTSWVRYSKTFSVPSISGKTIGTGDNLGVYLQYDSGTINSVNIDVWGFQIEAGSVATPFQTATGTLQGELAACQRYYFRQTAAGITEPYAQGFAYNTTGGYAVVAIPSNMRVKPTAIEVSNVQISDWINNIATTVTIGFCVSNNVWLSFTGSGYTSNRPYVLNASSATSHLGFSAEL